MSLRNTLRKAAGLLVELPPEDESQTTHSQSGGAGSSTDQLWAELEKAAQSPASSGTPTSAKPAEVMVVG